MRSLDAFVAKTDSGENIKAVLEAASPWDKWIRIYKKRDAAEGWRWQFWDDMANFLDSSSTATKAAFPALSGTSYVGYALKVSAKNGIATGRLLHINGANSVITDGLANSRKVVMLRNEAVGNWFFYHPDLTAGKLLYLNLTNAETTDATINSVTASGFTVADALASGTYRWIALAEIDGFLKLFKSTGNGSVDGPFEGLGLSPALILRKVASTTGNGFVKDAARQPYNSASASPLLINQTTPETTDIGDYDFLSNGSKPRNGSPWMNTSGATYAGLAFAAFPFRYANAR